MAAKTNEQTTSNPKVVQSQIQQPDEATRKKNAEDQEKDNYSEVTDVVTPVTEPESVEDENREHPRDDPPEEPGGKKQT